MFSKLIKDETKVPKYLLGKGAALVARAVVESALTIERGYHRLVDLVVIAWGLALLERAKVITLDIGAAPLRRASAAERARAAGSPGYDAGSAIRTDAIRKIEDDSDIRETLEGLLSMDLERIHLGNADLKKLGEIAADIVDPSGVIREAMDAEEHPEQHDSEAGKERIEAAIVARSSAEDEPPLVPHPVSVEATLAEAAAAPKAAYHHKLVARRDVITLDDVKAYQEDLTAAILARASGAVVVLVVRAHERGQSTHALLRGALHNEAAWSLLPSHYQETYRHLAEATADESARGYEVIVLPAIQAKKALIEDPSVAASEKIEAKDPRLIAWRKGDS